MTTITVIGGTGFAGSSIVREAATRGHEVTSVSRTLPSDRIVGVTYRQGTIADAPISGAEVIVGAVSARGETAGTLIEAYGTLAKAAAAQDARLIIIGGFSSLRPASGAPRFAEGDGIPAEFAAEALEMNAVLNSLADAPENLDWVFVSPAGSYGAYAPVTEPTGTYRVGGDVAILDDDGHSAITGPDFALAIVDEIEKNAHHREHISIVG
ncbi:NAD(P)-dependent oxidoreductase [soil metagenome]